MNLLMTFRSEEEEKKLGSKVGTIKSSLFFIFPSQIYLLALHFKCKNEFSRKLYSVSTYKMVEEWSRIGEIQVRKYDTFHAISRKFVFANIKQSCQQKTFFLAGNPYFL